MAIPMIATKGMGALGGTLLLESGSGKRVVELEAKTRVSSPNKLHRLRNFLFYKEKNSDDTTNDEVHSWRRDRCGSHLLLRFVERTSEGEEDE